MEGSMVSKNEKPSINIPKPKPKPKPEKNL